MFCSLALIPVLLVLQITPPLHLTNSNTPASYSSAQYKQHRDYKLGEILRYKMIGNNQGWKYGIEATDVVKQDSTGAFYEEVGWSNLKSNAPMTLSPSSLAFRQTLSMDGARKYLVIPNLSTVQPALIGPITDLLTFYADLFIAKQQKLTHAGQHSYFKHGTPNSWADGHQILLGQDSIDFDLAMLTIYAQQHTVSLLIRHVPPKRPQVKLPAEWMNNPVSNTPNNWVQVENSKGKYIAQVGKEVFEAQIVLDTRDGKILTAHLDNPIIAISRECKDAALTNCGPPSSEAIHREVSLQLLP